MDLRSQVIAAMKEHFGGDAGRVDHALAVLGHAEALMVSGAGAGAPIDADVVIAAAVLHDVGILAAIRKYGSAEGRWQELEGPPIAREILRKTPLSAEQVEHACAIVANHHSARDIDTQEFRIVYDADWLVNLPQEKGLKEGAALRGFIEKTFKTATGRARAMDLYIEKGTKE